MPQEREDVKEIKNRADEVENDNRTTASGAGTEEESSIKVTDRRHWAREDDGEDDNSEEVTSTRPTIVDEYRLRAETAEERLQDYIAAYKQSQAEMEGVRAKLADDVERKASLRFGDLVGELLGSLDDLDRALGHIQRVPEAASLGEGVTLVRDRFLATLERHGVEKIEPEGEEFDPNVAEALRVDPVDDPDLDGKVTELLRPGYCLGDRVIRAAQVAVGRIRQ